METLQLEGLWNFYGRFVLGYSEIVTPITDLLKGNGKDFNIGEAQEAAF